MLKIRRLQALAISEIVGRGDLIAHQTLHDGNLGIGDGAARFVTHVTVCLISRTGAVLGRCTGECGKEKHQKGEGYS